MIWSRALHSSGGSKVLFDLIVSQSSFVAITEFLNSNGHISTGLKIARPPNLVGRLYFSRSRSVKE